MTNRRAVRSMLGLVLVGVLAMDATWAQTGCDECPGDSDGNLTVNFDDIITSLGNFNVNCPGPASTMLKEAPADPVLLQQVQLSPLTLGFEASLADQGLLIDFGRASEIVFDYAPGFTSSCPLPPADARHLVAPVIDPGGFFHGYYTHSSSVSAAREGADFMRMFSPLDSPAQDRICIFTSPDLLESIDLIFDPLCGLVVELKPPGPRETYLECVGRQFSMIIGRLREAGITAACIQSCRLCGQVPTQVTCAGCAACAIGALGVAIGIWWCC